MLKSIKSTLILSTGNSFRSLGISSINLNKCVLSSNDSYNHPFWAKKQKNLDLETYEDVYLNTTLINRLEPKINLDVYLDREQIYFSEPRIGLNVHIHRELRNCLEE
jgi:hypothetical protein